MERTTLLPRGDYRRASKPDHPRFTVTTVRPDEYAEPPRLIRRIAAMWAVLRPGGPRARVP